MSTPPGETVAMIGGAAEGHAPVADRLIAMLFMAVLLHAIVLLGITFVAPESGGGASPGMEVLLVTEDIPASRRNETAAYVAQRTQKGSGNTTQEPTQTPAAIAAAATTGQNADAATERARQPAGGAALTTSAADADIRYYAYPQQSVPEEQTPASQQAPRSGRGEGNELVLRGVLRADLWLSPDTRSSRLAPYLDHWRRKVERIGTLNYPVAARHAGLTGSPVIEVAIRSDGRLLEATVRRSSGFAELDQAALGILRLASPFDPFPRDLASEHRSIRFSYQWEFSNGRIGTGRLTQGRGAP
ncbi:MAG: energy transducer TonB [Gammaproteobacteria bacterium]|nr:energy transducer TonB [Gammaproteobacteria bacterium]